MPESPTAMRSKGRAAQQEGRLIGIAGYLPERFLRAGQIVPLERQTLPGSD
jgi:hypothetical protein